MPAKLAGLSLQFELERPLSKVLVTGTVEEPQFMLFLQGFEQPNAVCTKAELVAMAHQLIWVAQTVAGLPKQSSQEAAPPVPFPRANEADELTRALLQGTLGIAQHGLVEAEDRHTRAARPAYQGRDTVDAAAYAFEAQRLVRRGGVGTGFEPPEHRRARLRREEQERQVQAQHPPIIPPPQRIVPPIGQFQQPGARTPVQLPPPMLPPQPPAPWEQRPGACASFDNDMGAMPTTLKPWCYCGEHCVGCAGLLGVEVAEIRLEYRHDFPNRWMQPRIIQQVQNRLGLNHDAAVERLRTWLNRMLTIFSEADFMRERR